MPGFGIDTSVAVALMSGWHARHEACRKVVGDRLNRGDRLVLAGHVLVETYSVLTRLPPPRRLAPEAALELVSSNLLANGTIVAPAPAEYGPILREAVLMSVGGGRVYDHLIASSVKGEAPAEFVTLNPGHYRGLFDESVRIVEP